MELIKLANKTDTLNIGVADSREDMSQRDQVDALIVLPEGKIQEANVLQQVVQTVTDLVNPSSVVGFDLHELRNAIAGRGVCHIGIGTGAGKNKVYDATDMAVKGELLKVNLWDAEQIIVQVSGDIGFLEASNAAGYLQEMTGYEVEVSFSAVYDASQEEECMVAIIATGFAE